MQMMTRHEAMIYFGLDDEEELEQIVVRHHIPVEIESGRIVAVDPTDLKDALFEEHRRKVGHRPDDPEEMAKAQAAQNRQDDERRERMKGHTANLTRQLARRKG